MVDPDSNQTQRSSVTEPEWCGSTDRKLHVALLAENHPRITEEAVAQVRATIESHAELVLCDLKGEADLSKLAKSTADVGVVMGGDGSILRIARRLGDQQLPLVGVNVGRLGFLADLSPEVFAAEFPAVVCGECKVVSHMMFECEVVRDGEVRERRLGLNEVTVLGGPPYKILDIELYVDGDLATTYACDGLIISTPVGSTAHNLSAGGPILRKDVQAFVISAVSPHTLTVRPVVDTATRTYEMAVPQPNEATAVVVDGQLLQQLSPADRVIVRRAQPQFQLIELAGHSYYQTLREKLGWGGRMHGRRSGS